MNSNNNTPILPGTEQAVATLVVNPFETQLKRFNSTFALEGEVVGSVRRKVSKKGAVTLSLLPMKAKEGVESLQTKSRLAGYALEAYRRTQQDALKVEIHKLMGGLAADKNWTGRSASLDATGNVITVKLERIDPVTVTAMTEGQAMEFLARAKGCTMGQLREALGLIAAPEPQPEPAAPATNGEVKVVIAPEAQ